MSGLKVKGHEHLKFSVSGFRCKLRKMLQPRQILVSVWFELIFVTILLTEFCLTSENFNMRYKKVWKINSRLNLLEIEEMEKWVSYPPRLAVTSVKT